jgi:O-antigen/teichoic acid export membrane protein
MSTKVIARNSVWLGLETSIDFVASMFASISIARGIGPEHLGYYVYIYWLTRMSVILGNVGIPAMAVKYMAEYAGRDMPEVAKSLYRFALRIQIILACGITAGGLVLVYFFGSPTYRWPSILLVLSILPAMVNTLPTIANISIERPDKNVPGSFVSSIVYALAVAASLLYGWGLSGIALGIFISRSLEFTVRFIPVTRRFRTVADVAIPADVREKMFRFSAQSMVIMVLGVVVWDRSEILFLKHFCTDIRQIAFYSVAFNLCEQALSIVRIFGNSIATTVRAQYGRDQGRLLAMMASASRYIALIAFPLYFGMAALAGPAIRVAYGDAYASAIPVLVITALLTIPKAFQSPIQAMLQSTERQGFLMKWSLVSAALNLMLDWLLIPRYGAVGAAYGNGLAQMFAVVGFWAGSVRMLRLQLPYGKLLRVLLATALMAAVVTIPVHSFGSWTAIAIGIPAGTVTFLLLLRLLGTMDQEDRGRFLQLRSAVPKPLHAIFDRLITSLVDSQAVRSSLAKEVG